PAVEPGQQVVAYETVLGHVMKDYEHVHFTELQDGHPVNPLAPGHLGPYDDRTVPTVGAISFRGGDQGPDLLPEFVHGRVVMVASAQDMPSLAVPGIWGDLPVAPALLEWRVEQADDGTVVVPSTVAFDVRKTIPSNLDFWKFYARGSRQNMSTFGGRRSWRES